MLTSGNGRHRKPRQTPTAVVAVAATGAGLALPLFAASGAQAAPTTTWNAVALCESGGLWSANTGNGFYGGLQISQDTWDQYGGQEFAERPDLASQNQQITVAEEMLDSLGPYAWPTCAASSGLVDEVTGKDDDSASDDATDATDEAKDEATDEATGEASDEVTDDATDDATDGATDTATPADSATDDADSTATASPSPAPTEPGAGSEAASPSASATAPAKSQGRHAKPEAAQLAEALAAWGELSPSTAADTADATGTQQRYRVREGDSLCDIAAAEDVDGGWRALYEANKNVIGDDPGVIHPGQYLTVG